MLPLNGLTKQFSNASSLPSCTLFYHFTMLNTRRVYLSREECCYTMIGFIKIFISSYDLNTLQTDMARVYNWDVKRRQSLKT